MINWESIDTVLLDMDGTLLDLHFDNHFWLTHVPQHFADQHGLELEQAQQQLFPRYRQVEGSLDWYCVDYWSERLNLDIVQLKHELAHKIQLRPNVVEFLHYLRARGIEIRLVTNAHEKAIGLKMQHTWLSPLFDMIISSHQFGAPKEEPAFWRLFQQRYPFDPRRTLFIDDNLAVLHTAREYGVAYLLAISQPDSRQPERQVRGFPAIHSFLEIIPGYGGR